MVTDKQVERALQRMMEGYYDELLDGQTTTMTASPEAWRFLMRDALEDYERRVVQPRQSKLIFCLGVITTILTTIALYIGGPK